MVQLSINIYTRVMKSFLILAIIISELTFSIAQNSQPTLEPTVNFSPTPAPISPPTHQPTSQHMPSPKPTTLQPTAAHSDSDTGLVYENLNILTFDGTQQGVKIQDILKPAFNLTTSAKTVSAWITTQFTNGVVFSLGLKPTNPSTMTYLTRRKLTDSQTPAQGVFMGVLMLAVGYNGGIYFVEQGTRSNGDQENILISDTSVPTVISGYRTHIAIVTTHQTISAFINGIKVYSKAVKLVFNQDIIVPNVFFCVGGDCASQSNYFQGTIDGIRFYNRSLTQADILNMIHRSMHPTTLPTPVPSSVPTYQPLCLKLLLVDTFGDGWQSARLVVFGSNGNHKSYMLQCGHNRLYEEYCFVPEMDNDGDYIIISVLGFRVDHYWEIFWQVFNEFDGQLYTGDFETSLTFVYNKQRHGFTKLYDSTLKIDSTRNLLPNTFECQPCADVVQAAGEDGQSLGVWKRPRAQDITSTAGLTLKYDTKDVYESIPVESHGIESSSTSLSGALNTLSDYDAISPTSSESGSSNDIIVVGPSSYGDAVDLKDKAKATMKSKPSQGSYSSSISGGEEVPEYQPSRTVDKPSRIVDEPHEPNSNTDGRPNAPDHEPNKVNTATDADASGPPGEATDRGRVRSPYPNGDRGDDSHIKIGGKPDVGRDKSDISSPDGIFVDDRLQSQTTTEISDSHGSPERVGSIHGSPFAGGAVGPAGNTGDKIVEPVIVEGHLDGGSLEKKSRNGRVKGKNHKSDGNIVAESGESQLSKNPHDYEALQVDKGVTDQGLKFPGLSKDESNDHNLETIRVRNSEISVGPEEALKSGSDPEEAVDPDETSTGPEEGLKSGSDPEEAVDPDETSTDPKEALKSGSDPEEAVDPDETSIGPEEALKSNSMLGGASDLNSRKGESIADMSTEVNSEAEVSGEISNSEETISSISDNIGDNDDTESMQVKHSSSEEMKQDHSDADSTNDGDDDSLPTFMKDTIHSQAESVSDDDKIDINENSEVMDDNDPDVENATGGDESSLVSATDYNSAASSSTSHQHEATVFRSFLDAQKEAVVSTDTQSHQYQYYYDHSLSYYYGDYDYDYGGHPVSNSDRASISGHRYQHSGTQANEGTFRLASHQAQISSHTGSNSGSQKPLRKRNKNHKRALNGDGLINNHNIIQRVKEVAQVQSDVSVVESELIPTAMPSQDEESMPSRARENFKYNLGVTSNLVWFSDDGFGADFEIFKQENDLISLGTRCGYNDKHCDLQLQDGNYYWRVSGTLLPASYRAGISWDFCGTSGPASSELAFTVSNGECNPITVRNLSAICSAGEYMFDVEIVSSEVILSGEVSLTGVASHELNDDHLLVVRSALVQELRDAAPQADIDEEAVSVTFSSTVASEHADATAGRALAGSELRLQFYVTLHTKDFGVLGRDVDDIRLMTNELKVYLQRSMSSGLFLIRVRAQAKSSGVKSLQKVSRVELQALVLHRVVLGGASSEAYSSSVVLLAVALGAVLGIVIWSFRPKISSKKVEGFIDASTRQGDLYAYPLSGGLRNANIHELLTRFETHC